MKIAHLLVFTVLLFSSSAACADIKNAKDKLILDVGNVTFGYKQCSLPRPDSTTTGTRIVNLFSQI